MRSYTETRRYYTPDETQDSVREKFSEREGHAPEYVFLDPDDGLWKAGPVSVLVQETAEVEA